MSDASTLGQDADTQLVLRFLRALADDGVDAAVEHLSPDVEYINVSLPAIHGREGVRQALGPLLARPGAGFDVVVHHASAEGGVVLTDRTDVIIAGPVRIEFWVYGRFVVRDGLITVWRDSFDWANIAAATVRGLARAALARGR